MPFGGYCIRRGRRAAACPACPDMWNVRHEFSAEISAETEVECRSTARRVCTSAELSFHCTCIHMSIVARMHSCRYIILRTHRWVGRAPSLACPRHFIHEILQLQTLQRRNRRRHFDRCFCQLFLSSIVCLIIIANRVLECLRMFTRGRSRIWIWVNLYKNVSSLKRKRSVYTKEKWLN